MPRPTLMTWASVAYRSRPSRRRDVSGLERFCGLKPSHGVGCPACDVVAGLDPHRVVAGEVHAHGQPCVPGTGSTATALAEVALPPRRLFGRLHRGDGGD